jgi:hypothetical protein
MIQDCHPLRSFVADGVDADYKADVVATTGPWTLNTERIPNGQFTLARSGVGIANGTFPSGTKVRGARANVDSKVVTNVQYDAHVVNINETAGTFQVVCVRGSDGVVADPLTGSVLYVSLRLEAI